MRRIYSCSILSLLAMFPLSGAVSAENGDLAFKGAMGFGANTPAGQGGQVIKVTTLDATGSGSFAEALQTKGPRIIVFEVGGIIDFKLKSFDLTEPYVTIAGQTAPSPGITIIKGGLHILTHDVVMQHIRIRPGDADKVKVPWGIDALSTVGSNAYNIVIDHCSFSWGVDGTVDVSGPNTGPENTSHRVTLSCNIIAESLSDSIHPKKIQHSRSTLINDYCRNIALIRNIYAHNDMRNPDLKPATSGVIVNNLIYDPGSRAIHAHGTPGKGGSACAPEWAIVGNQLICGPSTGPGKLKGFTFEAFVHDELGAGIPPAKFYLKDNDSDGKTMTAGGMEKLTEPPVWPEGLMVIDVKDVYAELLAHSGARAADRDAVDQRIVNEIRTRTGKIINSQNDVGGYPSATPTYRTLTVPPADQIPVWLQQMAEDAEGR